MKEMGDAMMGTGVGKGENRSIEAAQAAISSPLLEGVSINGAQGVLVNITGGPNLTMSDVDGVMNVIYDTVNSDMANIIFGTVIDDNLSEELYVTVIATGFNKKIESSTITQAPPQIKKIPTGASELKQYDAPAINRRSAENSSRLRGALKSSSRFFAPGRRLPFALRADDPFSPSRRDTTEEECHRYGGARRAPSPSAVRALLDTRPGPVFRPWCRQR